MSITSKLLTESMSYNNYSHLLHTLFAEGKTTGHTQSAEYLDYAKVNLQRMARLEKTTVLSPELIDALNGLKGNYVWLVITEGWCGDAAQNVPVFDAIDKVCPAIELKIILRDDHLDVMDNYLTNGSRSIPKLIVLEKSSLKELFVWGPRPEVLQNIVVEMVKNNMTKPERGLAIQKWYNADKTQTLQGELIHLIREVMP
jgi:Thioredoxin